MEGKYGNKGLEIFSYGSAGGNNYRRGKCTSFDPADAFKAAYGFGKRTRTQTPDTRKT